MRTIWNNFSMSIWWEKPLAIGLILIPEHFKYTIYLFFIYMILITTSLNYISCLLISFLYSLNRKLFISCQRSACFLAFVSEVQKWKIKKIKTNQKWEKKRVKNEPKRVKNKQNGSKTNENDSKTYKNDKKRTHHKNEKKEQKR